MNVKSLIKFLEGCMPDSEVVLSSDEEGNRICQLEWASLDTFTGEMPEWGDINEYWEDVDYDNPDESTRQIIILWPAG